MKLSILIAVSCLVLLAVPADSKKSKAKPKPKGYCPPLAKAKLKIFKPYTESAKGNYQ